MSVRNIIDKRQVDANLDRSGRMNVPGSDFLLTRMSDDLADRLAVINKAFASAHLVCPWYSKLAPQIGGDPKISRLHQALATPKSRSTDVLDLAPSSTELMIDIAHLHQVNDVPGMLIQYRRALRPDGLFLACVPGGDTLTELRQSLVAAESKVSGGVRPRVLPFMDVRDAGGLLQRAGFALPVTDSDTVTVRYSSMVDLMHDLRAMGATNTLVDRPRSVTRRDLFAAAAAHYAEHFSDPDGRLRATFSFIWMSGWAPAASQPSPLKPGSAKHSLAEALKDKSG